MLGTLWCAKCKGLFQALRIHQILYTCALLTVPHLGHTPAGADDMQCRASLTAGPARPGATGPDWTDMGDATASSHGLHAITV